MKDVKLIVSKRTVAKVMKDFLNVVNAVACGETTSMCSLTQGDQFCAKVYETPRMGKEFQYNLEQLMAIGSDYSNGIGSICANMGQRASYMKGFSQVTKVLLHEMGHHFTYHQIMKLYGEEEITRLYKEAGGSNEKYVHIPTEWVATQWAINWLADPEHRKIAKAFEKEFWACFE